MQPMQPLHQQQLVGVKPHLLSQNAVNPRPATSRLHTQPPHRKTWGPPDSLPYGCHHGRVGHSNLHAACGPGHAPARWNSATHLSMNRRPGTASLFHLLLSARKAHVGETNRRETTLQRIGSKASKGDSTEIKSVL